MDDNTNPQEIIQEGEIIQTPSTQTTQDDQSSILLNLDALIKSNISAIERIGEEMKKKREMFADAFNNDPIYREHDMKVKEANKIKLQTKQQILKQPTIAQLADNIRSLQSDIKERKTALSDYLLEYQRLAGVNEIEGEDGSIREIIHEAKLIKRTSRK